MSERTRWWWWSALALCMALAVRLVGFGTVPVSLYWDEMAIWNDALSIAETGRDVFDRHWFQALFISYGDFKMPVYIWLTALVSEFGVSEMVGVRVVSLLAGVSMIPAILLLIYWLEDELPTTRWATAVASSLTLTVLPWSLHFSRVGYEGHLSAAFLLWSVASWWGLARSTDWRSRSFWWSVSLLTGTLAVYSYFSTRFVWPLLLVGAVILFWPKLKKVWMWFLVLMLLWAALLVPMFQADFYTESNRFRLSTNSILNNPELPHEINEWRLWSGNTIVSRVMYNRYTFVGHRLAQNMATHWSPQYLFLHGDDNLRHGTGMTGLLFWWMALPFFMGWLVLVWKKPRLALWLFGWWSLSLVPASVPTDVPHALRSLNALPVLPLVVGIGAAELLRRMSTWKVSLQYGVFFGVLSLVSVSMGYWWYSNMFVYPVVSSDEWQDGYLEAARYIAEKKDEYQYIYVDSFDSRFYLYYQPVSGVTWAELQKMPSQDFQRSLFENVRMDDVSDWLSLQVDSVVVTRRNRVPEDFTPFIIDTITGAAGKEEFVVVATPRSH